MPQNGSKNTASSEKLRRFLFTGALSLSIFLFFLIVEPAHLRFQEQFQMFLFTSDYLAGMLSFPGGPATYLGRFLTQFMISPVAGAAVIVILFIILQQLLYLIVNRRSFFWYVIAALPSLLLTIYMCNENALLSASVAIIAGLAISIPIKSIKNSVVRNITSAFAAAAVYFLCGNLGVIAFAVGTSIGCSNILTGLYVLLVALVCTFLSRYCFDYPFYRLLTGPHYNRYHDTVPVLPWLSAFSLCAIAAFSSLCKKENGKIHSFVAVMFVFAGLASGFIIGREADKEEMMRYSSMAMREDWDGIMKAASMKEPLRPIPIACLNLALAEKGMLGEWMFKFRQVGPEGLFYPYRREHFSPLHSSMVYWNIGFINSCQRFTFAAQEVIPDYQKSAWCHKRLAEIYLVNEEYDISRKYLEPLKYTLFYRRWALATEKLLDNPSSISNHPVYGRIQSLMIKEHNCTYSIEDMNLPLYYHCLENNSNSVAYQYMLGLALLEKNLDRFAGYIDASGLAKLPTAFQEAYILYWSMDHSGPEGLPESISQRVIDKFMRFSSEINNADEEYIWSHYSDTYWFYYFFRNKK